MARLTKQVCRLFFRVLFHFPQPFYLRLHFECFSKILGDENGWKYKLGGRKKETP